MPALPSHAAAKYEEDGYYLYHGPVFAAEKFQRLCDLFEDILAHKDEGTRADQLDTPHFHRPELLEFLLDDQVLDLVEPIIGPDIGLWSSHFICKEPRQGRATPWHEDSAYWKGRFDHFGGIVTIWLALDRSDRENGCMKVIPGSHHLGGDSEYEAVDPKDNLFATRIKQVDEDKAVYFELEPNECSLHDSRLIHGADPNTSDRRRCGYTMRYFSQQMKFNTDHPGNKTFRIWHARGDNPHQNPVVNG